MIENEAYAIVYALQNLYYYLDGEEFGIKMDHKLLKYLFVVDWTNKDSNVGLEAERTQL